MKPTTHRLLTSVVLVSLAAAACTTGGDDTTDTSPTPNPATEPASNAPPATDIDGEPADESAGDARPATSAPIATTTTTTTITTTTTMPPPAALAVEQVALDDGSTRQRIDTFGDVATSADGTRMLIVGSIADAPGAAPRAALRVSVDGREFDDVLLDDFSLDDASLDDSSQDDASLDDAPTASGPSMESSAAAIATAGAMVAIAGTVVDADGTPATALWTSSDDAATFERASLPSLGPSVGSTVLVTETGHSVVSITLDGSTRSLVASTTTDGTDWTNTELPIDGTEPDVGGITLFGEQIVVTGSFDVGANRVGASWISSDGGASFVRHVDDTLAVSARMGPPSVIDGRLVAMASQPGNLATRLVTSSDGITWEPTELNVTRFDQALSMSNAAVGDVVAWGDGYALGTTEQLGAVAIVDRAGQGTLAITPYRLDEIYGRPIPYLTADGLFAIGASNKSFRVVEYRPDTNDWNELGSPGARTASGPVANGVDLVDRLDGVTASASTYPDVSAAAEGGIEWIGSRAWLLRDGDDWAAAGRTAIPADTEEVATNGDLEIATIDVVADPADNATAGPIGGTAVAFRELDGAWSDETLLLTGPGGDDASDVAATSSGFLLVGARRFRDEQGRTSSTAVLQEYVDGTWSELPIGTDLGPDVSLNSVIESDTGTRVATGTRFDGAEYRPFVLSPDEAGVWNRIDLPGATPGLTVVDLVGSSDTVELLTQEDGDWFRYVSADGETFERRALDFGDVDVTVDTAVEVDGRVLLVGTTDVLGVRTVSVWQTSDDGTTESLELDGSPTGDGLFVTDALANGDELLVGVVSRNENLVVGIDLS